MKVNEVIYKINSILDAQFYGHPVYTKDISKVL